MEVRPLQSNNPAFSQTFAQNLDYSGGRTATMTVQGTALKALVLLAILSATAAFSWIETEKGTMTTGFLIGSVAGGFVLALITMFKPTLAPWTSPVYAALEGIFLGALSRMTDERYPGLAIQAVALTGGVMFLMLFVYVTGIVKVTGQLTSAIVAATGAIALLYLATIVLSMFHIQVPFIMGSSPIGIAFSLFVHREGLGGRAVEVDGVVRRFRPDGHPGLAVPGSPPAPPEAPGSPLNRVGPTDPRRGGA